MYGAPEKIDQWLANGGRRKRAAKTVLQPSGKPGKKLKKQGNLKTFVKRSKISRKARQKCAK